MNHAAFQFESPCNFQSTDGPPSTSLNHRTTSALHYIAIESPSPGPKKKNDVDLDGFHLCQQSLIVFSSPTPIPPLSFPPPLSIATHLPSPAPQTGDRQQPARPAEPHALLAGLPGRVPLPVPVQPHVHLRRHPPPIRDGKALPGLGRVGFFKILPRIHCNCVCFVAMKGQTAN